MIVDTSAVVAFVKQGPETARVEDLLARHAPYQMSAATRVELGLVLGKAMDENAIDHLLEALSIEVVPLTPHQAAIASAAHRRYGRGNHPAALNLGDTYSYALATDTDTPLLFVGNDFSRTDVPVVH